MSNLNLDIEELLKLKQKPNRNQQEESLAIKLITLTSLLDKLKDTYNSYYLPFIMVYIAINEYLIEKFEPNEEKLKTSLYQKLTKKKIGDSAKELLIFTMTLIKKQPIRRNQIQRLSEIEKAYLNRALLALEGACSIQKNDQLILETTATRRNQRTGNPERIGTPVIAEAIGIILSTAFGQYTVYYAYDQINNKRLELPTDIFNDQIPILETPKLKEYYRTALISISANQEILKERIKEISIQIIEGEIDILESRKLQEITEDIWDTINDLINRINLANNPRLEAILLTLEGTTSIAREFYPFVLENDKQRPGRILTHISTRTQTLFPELSGRAFVKEKEKQRDIYNNFLENTQIQIEGINRRLIAESPEFYKIPERDPRTGGIFYRNNYNNQFTILPYKFHHLILHHLDAIDNILYAEGARYKLFFEEEESYSLINSEINKRNQEFAEKIKIIEELELEKEKLEEATNKIINRILTKKSAEKPKRTRSNSL
ncbi:hypothetical protein C2G38_2209790 [Gigaspora rosea]|uniref:Uncharacterized protein n=1 Tax=Gigaspora rosea TaxID=44941 RepID=A0A397UJ14_9GLOM|nr:hypothetical protein C2G38_2209790 [Gigaspora rosea]